MSLRIFLGLLLCVYGGAAWFLYANQRSFIYFPAPAFEHPHPVEVVASGGEKLQVVVVNAGMERAVIYFGGNAEAVAANAADFADWFPRHTLYLMNYRGYGGSSGAPAEMAFYEDAENLYDAVERRHHSISVIGRSIGSGVATHLASVRELEKLVLVTPFDSILNIARDRYPIFPVNWLLQDRFDSHRRVQAIDAETLVIVAEDDAVVPARYSGRLIRAFPESQLRVATLRRVGHNGVSSHPDYSAILRDFLSPGQP